MIQKIEILYKSERHKKIHLYSTCFLLIPWLIMFLFDTKDDNFLYIFTGVGGLIWGLIGSIILRLIDFFYQLYMVIFKNKNWGDGFL